jgi:nitrate/TMAO reductase-like tetraheme cytochrome c subunit
MVKKRRVSAIDTFLGTPNTRAVKNPLSIGSPSKPRGQDSRRSFSPTQKKEILSQQDNKCAKCHEKLDPRATHFHHEKPWASGGRTITENGRALCASCHEITSHEKRLENVDKKRPKKKSSLTLW